MQSRNFWRFAHVTLFLMILLCRFGVAQVTSGSLIGVVRDSSGATISGASVTTTETATNAHRGAKSNSKGEYELLDLSPGTYTLHVEANGFRGYDQTGIRLDLNQHGAQDVDARCGSG